MEYSFENVRTSGAYVIFNGFFVFQVGPTENGDKLGVVRLGGHSEEDESPLDTVIREVLEEAGVKVNPINSPFTYYLECHNQANKIFMNESEVVNPILIKGNKEELFSVMYIALAGNEPHPSSESKGLLLLSPKDVELICSRKITLNEFLKQNGYAKLKDNFNKDLVLEPFPQLIFLSNLLKQESNYIEKAIKSSTVGNDQSFI